MGIFDLFKKKPKFTDDLFGELRYTTFRDTSRNFYDGTVVFDQKEISVTIEADEKGPTKKQKDFYAHLRNHYPAMKADVIIPYLKKELDDWEDEHQIIDFDNEFTLDGISLPRITDQPVHWSLTLYSIAISHYVTIAFIDLDPQNGIIVDG